MPVELTAEVQRMIAAVAQAIELAREAFGSGDENGARSILHARASDILRMAVLADDADVRMELVRLYEAVGKVGG